MRNELHVYTDLYSVAEIRAMEQDAAKNLPHGSLMGRAGAAAAAFAHSLMTQAQAQVLVLAGPGNNGGDALETARLLAARGNKVCAILCAEPAAYTGDAAAAYQRASASPVEFHTADYLALARGEQWALAIDGLFGIGLARPLGEPYYGLVERLNRLSQLCHFPVLALDVPSGLDADTGQVIGGSEGIAVRASHTISFIGNKPGLHTGAGRDYAGQVEVADLGIAAEYRLPARVSLNSPAANFPALAPRQHDSHKGSFGDVLILGGAAGMMGAPVLAARAAAHCGAGRVLVGFIAEPPQYDGAYPELMFRKASAVEMDKATVVAGPGLGQTSQARSILHKALQVAQRLVIDADALNQIAADTELQQTLAERSAPPILTPHPLEAGRLLGVTAQQVQSDRLLHARLLAERYHAVVVLKGSGSIIAEPDGRAYVNESGNPALATAGTGDVLAGMCGALLAQKLSAVDAARLAVCVHGQAADLLVGQGVGPIGLGASELIPAVRLCLNKLVEDQAGNIDVY